MRKITTRLISAALAAGMMLSILPASAFAAGVDTGGGSHSSPDKVTAQTLDVQNDADTEGTGTADDPYIIHTDAKGAPTGTSDKWATGTAGFSTLILKSDGYYSFPDSSVTQPVTYAVINSDTPLDAKTVRNVTIVDGVFAAPTMATCLQGLQNVVPTIAGGIYASWANVCDIANITGGVFDKKTNSQVVSYSSNNARILTANGCTIDTLIQDAAYVVGQQNVTIQYTGDITKLGGWKVTIGNDSSKKLSDLTGYAATSTNGSNIPTLFSFTMPGDADVTLTPLVSAELKIDETTGKPAASLLDSDGKADYANWSYDGDTLTLKTGDFAFDSKTVIKCPVSLESDATLHSGTFTETVTNENGGKIYGGVFVKNEPKQSSGYDYEHKMKPFTIDDADYSNYSVNGAQLTGDTFYFCVGNSKQTIQVAYTGADSAAIKGWQVTENETTENLAPGDSFVGYSNGAVTAKISKDNTAALDISAYLPYLIGDSFKLKAINKPFPDVDLTVSVTNKDNGDMTILPEGGLSYDLSSTENGYDLTVSPEYPATITFQGETVDTIKSPGMYYVTVTIPETEDHAGVSKDYRFYVGYNRTYSVTVNGRGEALYTDLSSNLVKLDHKVSEHTLITLKSTADADSFIRWNFEKTDGIQFRTADGNYTFNAEDVDFASPELTFYTPGYDVVITAVTDEPVPGDDDSTAASSDGGAGAIVAGTLLGGTAYLVGTHVWLNNLYGTVPTNRQQLALALWEKAGKPAPASTALFEDIRADNADAQAAARWCTEQGLVKDYGETTFKPGRYVFRVQALKAWYDLQKLND